jgi:glycosyltransferase involved in cell wall biosynthesis
MRVGISAEFIGTISCGMATHAMSLLNGLAALDTEHRFHPYLCTARARALVPVASHIVPRVVRPYSAWLRVPLTLPAELLRRPVDLFHAASSWAPPWCPVPIVATIHDLTFETSPQTYTRAMRWRLRWLVRSTAHRAVRVICGSRTSADELVRLYGIRPEKIRVIHYALDPSLAPVRDAAHIARVRARYGLARPYILYVGMIEPKKNIDRLIHAYLTLRRERRIPHQLAIAGRAGWLSRSIIELATTPGLEGDVRLLGEVPQADLAPLYSEADAMAFLSVGEGFGFPPLEAMACGVPVLAGRGGSLPEVLDDAAMFVDPHRPGDVVDSLARMLEDEGLRARLRIRGLERAGEFRPERTARQTVTVYEECLEEIGRASRTTAEARVRHSGRIDRPREDHV